MKRTMEARQTAERIIAEIKHELNLIDASTVGWTKVDFKHGYKSNRHAIDIFVWCEDNCGDFKKFGTTFWFREEKDASMFILHWL